MRELQVSEIEELDLFSKWLGPESAKHAQSLRASSVNDPARGLKRIWERLDDRYGSPELVEAALKNKLTNFPKLYELTDILSEIEATKEEAQYQTLLAYFDSSSGIIPIVNKLPYGIQEKWTSTAVKYKRQHGVSFPPFSVFVEFMRDISKVRNDPSFRYDTAAPITQKAAGRTATFRTGVSVKKTDVEPSSTQPAPDKVCPMHKTSHALNQCKAFRMKPLKERTELVKQYGICYRCCASTSHLSRTCKEKVQCAECESDQHPTALHTPLVAGKKSPAYGGEAVDEKNSDAHSAELTSKCTQLCDDGFSGKSCAETILVNVYPKGRPEWAIRTYAILDDQSNASLVKSEFFDLMSLHGEMIPYSLSSCAGNIQTSGRRAVDFVVESLDHSVTMDMPTLIECNNIPNIREEIPTPQVAMAYAHLADIHAHIPPLDDSAEILMLIGRNTPEAHHISDQRVGPRHTPFAQKLTLGWVIVGEVCLRKIHKADSVNVNKTNILCNGRPSLFEECPNNFHVRERLKEDSLPLGKTVFERTSDDDKLGMSIEDREFIEIMDKQMYRNSQGNWEAPLPFRTPRQRLPNNRPPAVKRAKTLERSLHKNREKKEHFVTFMQCVLDSGHAEIAPPLGEEEECWYLPIGVYHPQKPNQIRAVFDSSAQYEGVSLNNVLLTGPDMTNNLVGILLRLRKERVAITADIEQMFHCFSVRQDHRNFLRFLWYRDNNPDNDLIEYRMCVHVFGNGPSPAVATYGLRKTALVAEETCGKDVRQFVEQNLYVDDGITSLSTSESAVDLLTRTRQALRSEGNLRLHKIASNDKQVVSAFPAEDRAKDLKDLDLGSDTLPVQRSLEMSWDLENDAFLFKVSSDDKPYTRRGILSTANSLYDPLGFVAPVTIHGKLLLRSLTADTVDWDEPLPPEHRMEWENWRDSLRDLELLRIPRTYVPSSVDGATRKEVYVFSDASEKAIAAVAYLKTKNENGDQNIGVVLGKAKVAPVQGHTIPRLELCAAVLAVEVAETVVDQLATDLDAVKFYTDSRIVLGYVHNKSRRFHVYVANRVQRIRKSTDPKQWNYVPTDLNPADQATRTLPAASVKDSAWLLGPRHLMNPDNPSEESFSLIEPASDKELRPLATSLATKVQKSDILGSHRFERFSQWGKLVRSVAHLKHITRSFHDNSKCKGWHIDNESRNTNLCIEAELHIIREVQREIFSTEMDCIRNARPLPKDSSLLTLNPIIDEMGLLRIGGRLNKGEFSTAEKNPLIIPGRHHIASLLVGHHHGNVHHQGRHITEGAIRASGLWIISGKRLVSSIIHKCVKCRKLRGKPAQQKMADLPVDRLKPAPAFSYVGLDVFGPWSVVARRTRGGQANCKRWAVPFTCLTIRAVHIEVIEEMSSSSFINALRRFIAVRGKVVELRSDRGSNFVGSTKDLKIDTINVEDAPLKEFLYNRGVVWIFNPPHSSHMGVSGSE